MAPWQLPGRSEDLQVFLCVCFVLFFRKSHSSYFDLFCCWTWICSPDKTFGHFGQPKKAKLNYLAVFKKYIRYIWMFYIWSGHFFYVLQLLNYSNLCHHVKELLQLFNRNSLIQPFNSGKIQTWWEVSWSGQSCDCVSIKYKKFFVSQSRKHIYPQKVETVSESIKQVFL